MSHRVQEIAEAIRRAQDQTQSLEARRAALEELRAEGVIGAEEDLDTIEDHDVEDELAQIKDELDS